MKKEELIRWKKEIEKLGDKKYYLLSLMEPVGFTDNEYSEFEIKNQTRNTKIAVQKILKVLEQSVLTLASSINIKSVELIFNFSILVDRRVDDIVNEPFKQLDNVICIQPDILFEYYEKGNNKLKDISYSELSRYNNLDLMDEYIVNYFQFFSEMLKYGYDFDVSMFPKLLQNVNEYLSNEELENNFGSVSCLINFGDEEVKKKEKVKNTCINS